MFGRVRRAAQVVADGQQVTACGVLAAYNPEHVSGVLAAGMGGAAAFAGGGGTATTADGRIGSGAGGAVNAILDCGRNEQRRFVRLPGRILVVALPGEIRVAPWFRARHDADVLLRLEAGTFEAVPVRYTGQIGVRLIDSHGRAAILTTSIAPWHRCSRAALDAVLSAAR